MKSLRALFFCLSLNYSFYLLKINMNMNYKLKILVLALLMISCKTELKKTETTRLVSERQLTGYSMNNSSIRAIELIDSKQVAFAGSKGDVGILSENDSVVFKQN